MRFLHALKNDIYFQLKYGFYLLYAFFSVVYIAVLILIPMRYKTLVASLIILTDPAMLGIFFIGGIWLLERGEGLHRFWSISPLRSLEYVLAKSLSLAFLSTGSAALISGISLGPAVHLPLLSLRVFAGAVVFNLIGLTAASYARSVNHYMIIVTLPTVLLSVPPVLTAFGMSHPLLELFPGTILWRLIANALNPSVTAKIWMCALLILWFGLALFVTAKRIGTAMDSEGDEKI